MADIKGLKFTKDHDWVRQEGNRLTVGITDYAQNALGEIVFVELPEVGDELAAGDVLGTVESVKTVSDVCTPVAGKVVEINENLNDEPGRINKAPYDNWIAVIETANGGEPDGLMDADAYAAFCSEEE